MDPLFETKLGLEKMNSRGSCMGGVSKNGYRERKAPKRKTNKRKTPEKSNPVHKQKLTAKDKIAELTDRQLRQIVTFYHQVQKEIPEALKKHSEELRNVGQKMSSQVDAIVVSYDKQYPSSWHCLRGDTIYIGLNTKIWIIPQLNLDENDTFIIIQMITLLKQLDYTKKKLEIFGSVYGINDPKDHRNSYLLCLRELQRRQKAIVMRIQNPELKKLVEGSNKIERQKRELATLCQQPISDVWSIVQTISVAKELARSKAEFKVMGDMMGIYNLNKCVKEERTRREKKYRNVRF